MCLCVQKTFFSCSLLNQISTHFTPIELHSLKKKVCKNMQIWTLVINNINIPILKLNIAYSVLFCLATNMTARQRRLLLHDDRACTFISFKFKYKKCIRKYMKRLRKIRKNILKNITYSCWFSPSSSLRVCLETSRLSLEKR